MILNVGSSGFSANDTVHDQQNRRSRSPEYAVIKVNCVSFNPRNAPNNDVQKSIVFASVVGTLEAQPANTEANLSHL